MYLILCCSLRRDGNSRHMASDAVGRFWSAGEDVELLEMIDYKLPYCDGGKAYENEKVIELREKIRKAKGVIFALPVYNYGVNAVAKGVVELTGDAWNDKVVGFFVAAGGEHSYMSCMSFANSLMLDFRCLIVPRFVYATGAAFQGSDVADKKVQGRIKELCMELIKLGNFRAGEGAGEGAREGSES